MGRAFNIVIYSFLGECVLEHADVLLPSMTYVERTGVISAATGPCNSSNSSACRRRKPGRMNKYSQAWR